MAKAVTFKIKEGASGMWFATCDEPPGFFVSCTNLETLLRIVPDVIRGFLKSRDLKSSRRAQ